MSSPHGAPGARDRVVTGCGHAGVVNICRYAQRLTGDLPLYAVIDRNDFLSSLLFILSVLDEKSGDCRAQRCLPFLE